MATTTPNLSLSKLQPNQAETRSKYNQLIQMLDGVVAGITVTEMDKNTPPGSPTDGVVYHVGSSPTDAFTGKAGRLAIWDDDGSTWYFVPPAGGCVIEDLNTSGAIKYYSKTDDAWYDLVLDTVSQAEAEAGTATTDRLWTAQRVAQAIAALGGSGGSTFSDAAFAIQDNLDATKQIAFQASGITTATTRTITMPDADVDLSLVGTEYEDNVFAILDNADNTKKIAFQASGITTATTRTITMPDADVDLGKVYINMSAYVQNDGNALGRAALSARLREKLTIDEMYFSSNAGTFSGDDASNYWTFDVRYRASGGGNIAAATSLVSTPKQSDAAEFSADNPNQQFAVGIDQNNNRDIGDLIIFVATKTGSASSQASHGLNAVIEATRRA